MHVFRFHSFQIKLNRKLNMAFPITTEFMSHLVCIVVVWRKKLRPLIYCYDWKSHLQWRHMYDNDCVGVNKSLLTYLNHDYKLLWFFCQRLCRVFTLQSKSQLI